MRGLLQSLDFGGRQSYHESSFCYNVYFFYISPLNLYWWFCYFFSKKIFIKKLYKYYLSL